MKCSADVCCFLLTYARIRNARCPPLAAPDGPPHHRGLLEHNTIGSPASLAVTTMLTSPVRLAVRATPRALTSLPSSAGSGGSSPKEVQEFRVNGPSAEAEVERSESLVRSKDGHSLENPVDGHDYHIRPGGNSFFWRALSNFLIPNPGVSNGIPRHELWRTPPPASRPEHHAIPPSEASDPAGHKYLARDARRQYPRTIGLSQPVLTALALAEPTPEGPKALEAPAVAQSGSTLPVDTTRQAAVEKYSEPQAFTEALAHLSQNGAKPLYSVSALPPTPPFIKSKHVLTKNPGDIPVAPFDYFPGMFTCPSLACCLCRLPASRSKAMIGWLP